MKYHAPTRQMTVEFGQLDRAALNAIFAIRNIRKMAGLPLTKYESPGLLEPADHAQKAIIEAMNALGVDLGAVWGHELDVSTNS